MCVVVFSPLDLCSVFSAECVGLASKTTVVSLVGAYRFKPRAFLYKDSLQGGHFFTESKTIRFQNSGTTHQMSNFLHSMFVSFPYSS